MNRSLSTAHVAWSGLELLESRIAPAAIAVTYQDVDGDLVKITASKPGTIAPPLDAADLAFVGGGSNGQLATLTLTEAGFDGASLVFTVTKKAGGDGLAHVGFIDATGVDLDRVVVKGDLGKIIAGDAVTSGDAGLNVLQARTMGTLGLVTQGGAGDLQSVITGKLGRLKVAGDFTDVRLSIGGGVGGLDGHVGSVFIGGDLTGGTTIGSGMISCGGTIGKVTIGGDIRGGTGDASGRVGTGGGAIGDVRIGGNLIGGAGNGSGLLTSNVAIGHVRIGGDLIGGSATGSATLDSSGLIFSAGRVASVTIGGSLIAGLATAGGSTPNCGAIRVGDDLGPVKIGGSILGNSTNPVLIVAAGQAVKPTSGFDTAIASIKVGGDVRFARILGGFGLTQAPGPINADAAIGSVKVGGDWVASSVVAGAQDAGAPGFGVGDTLQTVGDTSLVARIASITIKGDVTGSLAAGDNFGFVAQQIDKLRIGTRTFVLAPGPSSVADNVLIPFTDDVHLLEVI